MLKTNQLNYVVCRLFPCYYFSVSSAAPYSIYQPCVMAISYISTTNRLIIIGLYGARAKRFHITFNNKVINN